MKAKEHDELDVFVVDDEPNAVRGLVRILERRPDVRISGHACSGEEAIEKVRELSPHVVLLDIQMPGMSGFDVIEKVGVDTIPFLIFVTAYHDFALQAFEVHAIDYILKPVDCDRLNKVLDRIQKRHFLGPKLETRNRVQSLLKTISAGEETKLDAPERLAIRSRGSTVFFSTHQITHIEAAGNYVRYFVDGDCYLSRATMNEVQRQLKTTSLVRVHRSRMVNRDRILKISSLPHGDFMITLDCGVKVSTGHNYREEILRIMKT